VRGGAEVVFMDVSDVCRASAGAVSEAMARVSIAEPLCLLRRCKSPKLMCFPVASLGQSRPMSDVSAKLCCLWWGNVRIGEQELVAPRWLMEHSRRSICWVKWRLAQECKLHRFALLWCACRVLSLIAGEDECFPVFASPR